MEEEIIRINGIKYKIIDILNNITLADSFVKNKIGTGHGEAKLYVGNYNDRYTTFFNLESDFFFLKKDFNKYMLDAKDEFMNPQQEYQNKKDMPARYNKFQEIINDYNNKLLKFKMERVDVKPPRVYLRSNSKYFKMMREIGLPNISYLSLMKLENTNNEIFYYCRIFIDYNYDLNSYESSIKKNTDNITDKKDDNKYLIKARKGQEKYREKLLEECKFCPFTGVNDERLLIASHIKPWVKSNDKEKRDPKNGFILTPTYDKLFDQGYITFDSEKKLKVSPWISPMNQKRLNIKNGQFIKDLPLDEEREKYLKYHRENIFKGDYYNY